MLNVPIKLFELIKICSNNLKGLTKTENIDKLLPIETEKIKIQKIERKIVISNKNKILGSVWTEFGCYSNLKILKLITKEYGLEPKSERILELMRYKYIIDNMFIEGEV